MARARPGLQKAINEILERNGVGGKPLSLRQAERRTGLSPATIGELAKGNARTPETLRRFARGFGENVEHLLLLAGFAEAIDPAVSFPEAAQENTPSDDGLRHWLERYGRALETLPSGRIRSLLLTRLRCDTELLESLLAGAIPESRPSAESDSIMNARPGTEADAEGDLLHLDDDLDDALDRDGNG